MKTPTALSVTSSQREQTSLRFQVPRLPRSNVSSTRDLENPSASVHLKRFSTPSLTLKFLCAGKLNPRKYNIKQVLSSEIEFDVIESDFRSVDYRRIGRFNIFLFDGPHEERDQYDGIMLAQPALDDHLTLIVDDWNWRQVRLGTFRAIVDGGWSVEASIEIRTTRDNTSPKVEGKESEWHNGYFLAVLRKITGGRGSRPCGRI
jgi:hypothetical protein